MLLHRELVIIVQLFVVGHHVYAANIHHVCRNILLGEAKAASFKKCFALDICCIVIQMSVSYSLFCFFQRIFFTGEILFLVSVVNIDYTFHPCSSFVSCVHISGKYS